VGLGDWHGGFSIVVYAKVLMEESPFVGRLTKAGQIFPSSTGILTMNPTTNKMARMHVGSVVTASAAFHTTLFPVNVAELVHIGGGHKILARKVFSHRKL